MHFLVPLLIRNNYIIFLFLSDSLVSEFNMPTFSEHRVCSIFVGDVSRKNNRDKIVRVFIREKGWLQNSLSQSEGGVGLSRETGCGEQRTQVEACSMYVDFLWW